MIEDTFFLRRSWLRTSGLAGTAQLLGLTPSMAASRVAKTPALTALHNHMFGESPRIIFLHYYGRGAATALASGFKATLDVLGKSTNSSHSTH